MLLTLTMGPAGREEPARIFENVAQALERAAARGDGRVEVALEGSYRGSRRSADAREGIDARLEAADRLEQSLEALHRAGGALTCTTRGEAGGPYLEIALMADLHVMSPGASLAPAGLFDDYVPCTGGWSRLIERAGAGRAAALLMTGARCGEKEALAAGLCERAPSQGDDAARQPAVEHATAGVARRLAIELSRRAGRGGGLTPSQARCLERAAFALAFSEGGPREAIAAFFRRKPPRPRTGPAGNSDDRDEGVTR